MTPLLFQAIDAAPLVDKLSDQAYIIFGLVLLMYVPLIVGLYTIFRFIFGKQNDQITAFRDESAKQRQHDAMQTQSYREDAALQRQHDEQMTVVANDKFNDRYGQLQAVISQSFDRLVTRHVATDQMITANSATLITGLENMNSIHKLNGDAANKHLEGIKQMLEENGQELAKLRLAVGELKNTVDAARQENASYYQQTDHHLAKQSDLLGMIEKSILDKLEETGDHPAQP